MTRVPDIELKQDELDLLRKIHFDASNREELCASLEPMAALSCLLLDRDAIPQVRLLYFTDAERNAGGGGKSWQDVFEGNGTVGDEILSHPSFLKFLEYFVFGPKLPQEVIGSFKEAAQSGGHLTRSDMQDLLPSAKALVKAGRMDASSAAEEFHKLALECGALPGTAASLRDSLRKMRIRG